MEQTSIVQIYKTLTDSDKQALNELHAELVAKGSTTSKMELLKQLTPNQ